MGVSNLLGPLIWMEEWVLEALHTLGLGWGARSDALQIPVFLSLYSLMRADVASGLFDHASFLFIPDLTAKPHGAVLVALTLLYLTSQLATSAVSTRTLEAASAASRSWLSSTAELRSGA